MESIDKYEKDVMVACLVLIPIALFAMKVFGLGGFDV